MRRALGLHNTSPTQDRPIPPTTSPGASHSQRRRFIRDGEVPVSVIRRDQEDSASTNKLDAARQALREQIAAREHAERLFQEAQATIHDLQTKLAHERLARDQAIQRVESEKQLVEQALQRAHDELAIERDRRQVAEHERDDAIAGRLEAGDQIQEMLSTLDALKKSMPTTEPSAGGDKVGQPRRRGRPAESGQSKADIVEWWKPGWQKQFR